MIKELKYTGLVVPVDDLTVCALAYADDIALIADSPENLQKLISVLNDWCKKWRFVINPSKSNVVHYRNPPKVQTNFIFQLGDNGPVIDITDNYKYLGVYLDQYLTFSKATTVLGSAAGRALGSMINKYKSMGEMGYSTYTKLFESLVCPVMDYSSAIWGGKSYDCLDNIFNRAQRFFTGVHRLCPIDGYTGDMGWATNRVRWKIDALRLWNRLIQTDKNRLVYKVFQWDMTCHRTDNKANFASNIKQILCQLDLKKCYKDQTVIDVSYAREQLMKGVEKDWKNYANKKVKLDLYNNIKTKYGAEKYLLLNIDKYEKSLLSQLRYGILPLRVETGRFCNEKREGRVCTLCSTNTVENVEHFLFECSVYDSQRLQFIDKVRDCTDNWDTLTYNECLTKLFELKPRALGKYVKDIFLYRRSKLYK